MSTWKAYLIRALCGGSAGWLMVDAIRGQYSHIVPIAAMMLAIFFLANKGD